MLNSQKSLQYERKILFKINLRVYNAYLQHVKRCEKINNFINNSFFFEQTLFYVLLCIELSSKIDKNGAKC
jgi:hypothetical protein